MPYRTPAKVEGTKLSKPSGKKAPFFRTLYRKMVVWINDDPAARKLVRKKFMQAKGWVKYGCSVPGCNCSPESRWRPRWKPEWPPDAYEHSDPEGRIYP